MVKRKNSRPERAVKAAVSTKEQTKETSSAVWAPSWAQTPLASRAVHLWTFVSVFVAAMVLYVVTMPRYVTMEDAGEFITSAYKLGIPHPPGYPLYTWVGHLFTYLPFGPVAFRIHLFSAVAAAATCGLLAWIVLRLRGSWMAAILSGLLFAVSRTLWSQAVIAEVYALNALLFFGLLLIGLKLHERWDKKWFWAFGFLYGLSISNHWPLIGLASAAFVVLFLPHWRQLLKALPVGLVLGVVGLSPYLLLFAANPEITFLGPMRNFDDLIAYILRKEYASDAIQPTATPFDGVLFAGDFLRRAALESGLLAAPFMLIGIWRTLTKETRWLGTSFLASFLSSSVILLFFLQFEFNNLTQVVFAVFHLVPFGIAAVWAAIGFDWLLARPQLARIPRAAVYGVVAVLVAQGLATNWRVNNLREDSFAFDFAKLALESLPQNAVFLGWADPDVGPFVYASVVEKIRPDVIYSTQTGVIMPVKIYDRRLVRTDKARGARTIDAIRQWFREGRRVFSIRRLYYFTTTPELLPFHYVNHGMYEEIVETPPAQAPDNRAWAEKGVAILDKFVAGRYGTQWSYHRDFIVNRLCRLMVKNGIEHKVFETHRDCKLMMLERVRDINKDLVTADKILVDVMKLSEPLPLQDQIESARHFFINRIQMVSKHGAPNGGDKMKAYQEAVDLVEPMALKVPGCSNLLILSILEAKAQIDLRVNMEAIQRTFGKCPKHKELLDKIRK